MVVYMAETVLGSVLTEWMQRQRLSPSALSDLSDLSRRTVYNVLDGKTNPGIETIWKLATGLATDPYSKAIDDLVYADAFPSLLEAGGFPPGISRVIRVDPKDLITRKLRDPEKSEQLMDFLDHWSSLPADHRDLFVRVIDLKNRINE